MGTNGDVDDTEDVIEAESWEAEDDRYENGYEKVESQEPRRDLHPVNYGHVEVGADGLPIPLPSGKRAYLVCHINGGQSELDPSDDVEFTTAGIVARHNDPGKSYTFYPWYNIVWIREYAPK